MKKTLTKNKKIFGFAIVAALLLACFLPIQAAAQWPMATPFLPYPVDGRILTKDKTGDVSDWVEIAKDGDYSLIVRKNFINIYPNTVMYGKTVYNDPVWQYPNGYGPTNDYPTSYVYEKINAWFNSVSPGQADKLPWTARLRDFTMHSNAKVALGTACSTAALINGFSKPTMYQVGIGDDVVFPLSYTECAHFLSKQRFTRGSPANIPSPPIAVKNYGKITMPAGYYYCMWLRSPGDIKNTAGALANNDDNGRVFQMSSVGGVPTTTYGLIYPAAWVDSEIFGNAPNKNKYVPYFPVPVDGRTLTKAQTGDVSEWVEIARSFGFSLIVRKNYINIYPNTVMYGKTVYNDPIWQIPNGYGLNEDYNASTVRKFINAWYNANNPPTNLADRLPFNARLRNFALKSNAKHVLGTCSTQAALGNGFSMPSVYVQGIGDDVAFALSFSECASFISKLYFQRVLAVANQPSNPIAVKNYGKITMPTVNGYGMWLRSAGDIKNTAGYLTNTFGSYPGRDFQLITSSTNTGPYGLVYPAMWVGSGIFLPDSATINIRHLDAVTGEELEPVSVDIVVPGPYGPYNPKVFPGYGTGTLAPYSAPRQGYIIANQTITITFLYQPSGTVKVIYKPNGASGTEVIDHADIYAGYTIKPNPFYRDETLFTFEGWNTQADGSGTHYEVDQVIYIDKPIELFAEWKPNF